MRAGRRLLTVVGIGCLIVALGACGDAAARGVAPPPGSVIPAPVPGGPLFGVTCVNASTCWAVGGTVPGLARSQAVIERSSGMRWARARLPATPSAYGYAVYGIACVSTARCWAVGSEANTSVGPGASAPGSGPGTPLIEGYDGAGWSLSEPGGTGRLGAGNLRGVACVSVKACWAVGSTGGSEPQPLIAQYDGVRWSVAAGAGAELGAGAKAAGDAGGSVGAGSAGGAPGGPADGVAGGAAGGVAHFTGELAAVSCQRDATCWAVGSGVDAAGRRHGLTKHFDGRRWSGVSVADPAGSTSTVSLDGISCTADDDCWAVGVVTASGEGTALIEHFSEGVWNVVPAAKPIFSASSSLASVTCVHASGCWAGGVTTSPTGARQVLVERSVGSSWSIVPAPALGPDATGSAVGVSCSDEDDCWTVGSCSPGSGSNRCAGSTSLIEFYDTILPDGH